MSKLLIALLVATFTSLAWSAPAPVKPVVKVVKPATAKRHFRKHIPRAVKYPGDKK